MKNKKMAIEITLIIAAGLITLILSVNSIIKAERQEAELNESQRQLNQKSDSIIALQTEMQNKSNQIIQLQNQLIISSSSQVENLNRLSNPIPTELKISFTSDIVLAQEEFSKLTEALRLVRGDRGNTLPTNFTIQNEGTNRIEKLKDILFELRIEFRNGNRNFRINIKDTPRYFGYHKTNLIENSFILALMRDKGTLEFNAFTLLTRDISCNYSPASIVDFNSSKVVVSYSFLYPDLIRPGDIAQKAYVEKDKDYMKLELKSLKIQDKNYSIVLEKLIKIDDFTYEADYQSKPMLHNIDSTQGTKRD